MRAMVRIGVDTGGTFTDFVIVHDGRLRTWKEPSTPDDPARAILRGLEAALRGVTDAGPVEIVHGSTVATNALLEGKTPPIAFVTNRGFEDILEIGRQARPDLYNLMATRPEPLAPRELRRGIAGRLGADGAEREPLDLAEVEKLAAALREAGVTSAAVCLLHAWANPAHEERVAAALESAGILVSASSRIVAEHREYERGATAAVNAAVAPLMSRYLDRLARGLREGTGGGGRAPRLLVMASNGGALSSETAGRQAVRTVLSGPAGGVRAAEHAGSELGEARLISFDMGGTSTDVSLLDGRARTTSEAVVAGHPLKVPTMDIHTVGAGGGSIGWRDPGGALRVGPASAGADPGPACYGRGGPPTVTDANLVLGRVVAERFLDGRMPLDAEASREAIGRLAAALGMGLEQTAEGMLDVAEATMARAIRVISLFRGHEPSGFTLLAFGGAGGLHAASLAASLGMRRVVVPAHPGVFSAFGMTVADIAHDASITVLLDAAAAPPGGIAERFARMERDLAASLAADGVAMDRMSFEFSADLRYAGQSFELNVPILETSAVPAWMQAFHAAHETRYGYRRSDERVELVTLRARGLGRIEPPARERTRGAAMPPESGTSLSRRVFFQCAWIEAAVRERGSLPASKKMPGPALVLESGATTFVPPGWSAWPDEAGHLHLGADGR
ncbi:MAG: hydantoinase/oxoprolinase family protein [Candidatus Polarisedimenticolia bacterium]